MNKWAQVIVAGVAAGMTQFGILVAAGVTQTLPLAAGVTGTIGATIAGLLKQLPRQEWTPERKAKLNSQK